MIRSFEGVTKLISNNLQRNKEFVNYIFEYFDKLIIWVVGFSVAGISVIITNLSIFNNLFDESIIKLVLFLFVISIFSGFIFKVLYLYYQLEYKKIENNLEMSLIHSNEILEHILNDKSEIKNIYFYVKKFKEIDIDLSPYFEFYEKADGDGRIEILQELDDTYRQLLKIQNTEFNNGIAYVKMIYKKNLGLSDKKINKIFNKEHSVTAYRILYWLTLILLSLNYISFLLVIFILTINY